MEIDLVLQGLPMRDYSRKGLPDWVYDVTVSRSTHPERYEIYTATFQKRLPRFRVPMAEGDRDIVLDLQVAFTKVYAALKTQIDYHRDPLAPLREADYRWLDDLLVRNDLRRPTPPEHVIAALAYQLWEHEGHPHGRDREHWRKALELLRRQIP